MQTPFEFFQSMRALLDAAPKLGQIADESRAQVLLEEFENRYPAIYRDLVRCGDMSPELVISTLAMNHSPEVTLLKLLPRWQRIVAGIQHVIKTREERKTGNETTVRDRVARAITEVSGKSPRKRG